MSNQEHERAIELIMREGSEGIAARDSEWLESHLAQCSECAGYAAGFDQTGRLLQSVAITASTSLVRETQAKVRARAVYLQEQRSRMVLIAISFCVGAMSSTLSAWLWWKFGAWVAEHLGVSSAIIEPGILLFFLLPAVLVAVLMLAFPHPVLDDLLIARLSREQEGEIR